MSAIAELEVHLRARYPLLYLLTPEEERALATLQALGDRLRKPLVSWSITEGLNGDAKLCDPLSALEAVRVAEGPGLYVFKDLHACFGSPAVVRKLRDLAQALRSGPKALVLLSPVLNLPAELKPEAAVLDFPPPEDEAIGQMLEAAARMASQPLALRPGERDRLVAAARGLTAAELANALARAMVLHRSLDARAIAVVAEEKRQAIRKAGLLEHVEAPADLSSVGGLGRLKGWLAKRQRAQGPAAEAFGLAAPRGILLVGAPGCGKSLTAQAVAGQWGWPLLRLDLGRVMAGLVGASEANMRAAIAQAEALAPVVLWIDELEKGLAGSANGDGGASARVLGTLLTWMAEKKAPVFVVATANELGPLPPELLRPGRFDATFFVELPDVAEREAILAVHLKRRGRDPKAFDLAALAAATEGHSGAELEAGVIEALYAAFDAGRPLTTDDLREAASELRPLSQARPEALARLRAWALAHARPASGQEGPAASAALSAGVEALPWVDALA